MHCMPAAMMKYPLEHKKSREIDLTQVETFFNKIVTFGGSADRLSQAVLIRFHLTGRQPYCRAYCAAMMPCPLKHNKSRKIDLTHIGTFFKTIMAFGGSAYSLP